MLTEVLALVATVKQPFLRRAGVQLARHRAQRRPEHIRTEGQKSLHAKGGTEHFHHHSQEVFSLLGDVYVVLEGGPSVANQARLALRRGACVLPVARTGGASCGLFKFPRKALEKPDFVEDGHWELLQSTEAPTQATAQAVVALLEAVCEHFPAGCGRSLLETDESEAEDATAPLSPAAWSRPVLGSMRILWRQLSNSRARSCAAARTPPSPCWVRMRHHSATCSFEASQRQLSSRTVKRRRPSAAFPNP